MTPRLTSTWKKRAQKVVDYIMSTPGATGKEISYRTDIALSTVHAIILHDPRAFQLARDGKIAILDRHIKPKWYHPSMTKVPVVKKDRLDPAAELHQLIKDNNLNESAQTTLHKVVDLVSSGVASPTRSLLQRKNDAVSIISNTQLLGMQYTQVKKTNDDVVPRIASLEKMVKQLTVGQLLENRYGPPQLRKKDSAASR